MPEANPDQKLILKPDPDQKKKVSGPQHCPQLRYKFLKSLFSLSSAEKYLDYPGLIGEYPGNCFIFNEKI
jgi:hypothetical protein